MTCFTLSYHSLSVQPATLGNLDCKFIIFHFADDVGRQDAGDRLGGDTGDNRGTGSAGELPAVAARPGEARQAAQLGTNSVCSMSSWLLGHHPVTYIRPVHGPVFYLKCTTAVKPTQNNLWRLWCII